MFIMPINIEPVLYSSDELLGKKNVQHVCVRTVFMKSKSSVCPAFSIIYVTEIGFDVTLRNANTRNSQT